MTYANNKKKSERRRQKQGNVLTARTNLEIAEATQLIDRSTWFLNQVNSGPNQHL